MKQARIIVCGCQCKAHGWQFIPTVELMSFPSHPTAIKISESQTSAVHLSLSPFLLLVTRLSSATFGF
jgi:hypothetical protein